MQNNLPKKGIKDCYSFDALPPPTGFGSKRVKDRSGKYIDRFLFDVPKHSSVLEIGPGRGEFASECLKRKWQYLGVESSDSVLKILASEGFNIINARVPPIPIADDSFKIFQRIKVKNNKEWS